MLLPAHNPSALTGATGNNTYLLTGTQPTLMDAGVGAPAHVEAIELALAGRPLGQVLITHGHADHLSGVPALRSKWPGVAIRKMLPGDRTDVRALTDGEECSAGDRALRVIATPGHAPDHACFLDVETSEIYCGDLVRSGGTILIAASRGGDLRQYLDSLARVRALEPRRLLPGHGPAIDDPAGTIDAYLRHRAEREAQVLEALGDGLRTAPEIARRIYRGLAAPLQAAAVDTVLAHLRKLEQDGRIVPEGDSGFTLASA